MKPLIFLTVRTIINGVRRAITTPRRLIGLIFLVLYWLSFLNRNFTGSRSRRYEALTGAAAMPMPSNTVIEACAFAIFSLCSIFLMLNTVSIRGNFRPADIDVLFPTPISPRLVLVFRIVRDVLLTLLIPLIFAIIARPVAIPLELFIRNYPSEGQFITKTATVVWFLLVLAWTCISYAVSLFINRSDERSDRNKRVVEWTVGLLVIGSMAYLGVQFRSELSWDTALRMSHDPVLRVVFFGASLASAGILSVFTHDIGLAVFSFGGLVGIIIGSFALAMTQVHYLYDQAAAKGFGASTMRSFQKSGDIYGMMAEKARSGKARNPKSVGSRVAAWIGRFQISGPGALLWKEMLLQSRTVMWSYYFGLPIVIFISVTPTWAILQSGRVEEAKIAFLSFMGFAVYMTSLNSATTGFIEFLRRVDFQKPLPFTSTVTVFWEVVPKVIPTFLICGFASVVITVLNVQMWDAALSAALMAPSLGLVLVAVILLVTVLFPDIEDATQRSFRGIMMMLGCVIASSPMLLVVGLLLFMKVNLVLVALPAIAINVGIAVGISAIAGSLYSNFNPSE